MWFASLSGRVDQTILNTQNNLAGVNYTNEVRSKIQ